MHKIKQILNESSLVAMLDIPDARAAKWIGPIVVACARYHINTPMRLAAFIAQIGVESGRLYYTKEIWGPMPWQERYEGRADLGNTETGDGQRYMGRGLIQITGRYNYTSCGEALGLDLTGFPALLEWPEHAAMSAAWYWDSHHLNDLADVGNIRRITKKINGGYRGLDERTVLYTKALAVLGVNGTPDVQGDVVENEGALI